MTWHAESSAVRKIPEFFTGNRFFYRGHIVLSDYRSKGFYVVRVQINAALSTVLACERVALEDGKSPITVLGALH